MTTRQIGLILAVAIGWSAPGLGGSAVAQDAKAPLAVPAPVPAVKPPAAGAPAAPAPGATAPAAGVGQSWTGQVLPGDTKGAKVFDEKQIAAIKVVSDYFKALKNLNGAFEQANPDGKKLHGKFYMKSPGKFRFDYALPSKQIIISDGTQLAIQDTDVNSDDRIELDRTPFRVLLKQDVDLMRDSTIEEVDAADDLIVMALRDKSPDVSGKIKLYVATKPAVELKEWVTTDPQNLDTRVVVSSLDAAKDLDAKLFVVKSLSTASAPATKN